MFAPRVLRAIYADELKRLDAYAREHHSGDEPDLSAAAGWSLCHPAM